MNMIIVAFALVATVAAAPVEEHVPQIVRSDFVQQPDGSYTSAFETENGIKEEQTGELKTVNDEENKPRTVVVVRGQYEYPRPDGILEIITYIADELGFHADGPSIPKAAARR